MRFQTVCLARPRADQLREDLLAGIPAAGHVIISILKLDPGGSRHSLHSCLNDKSKSRIKTPFLLFQNRYKSILVEEAPYLLELVRDIHLNPLRARAVRSIEKLGAYPWSGHGVLIGKRSYPWQDCGYILSQFGGNGKRAKRLYEKFVREGVEQGRRKDLTVYPRKMQINLGLLKGLMLSESVMIELGKKIGKQTAHEVVDENATKAIREELDFKQVLLSDRRVNQHLTASDIDRLLNPEEYIGLAPPNHPGCGPIESSRKGARGIRIGTG